MDSPKTAKPAYAINALIAERWSPYGYSDRPVSAEILHSLFEAARWAASSYNEQPWSFIVGTRASPADFEGVLSCLVEGNQAWARAAPVLAIGCFSTRFKLNGKPNLAAQHDLGLATANLALEATARGLHVHSMIGIVPEKAVATFAIPVDVQPLTGMAIGYLADPATLPEQLKQRDLAPRVRKNQDEFVFHGQWGIASRFEK